MVLSPVSNWQRLDYRQGPRPASREDILIALANVDSILVRASQSSDTVSAYISDISLDTAEDVINGQPRAVDVEVCRCPLVRYIKLVERSVLIGSCRGIKELLVSNVHQATIGM